MPGIKPGMTVERQQKLSAESRCAALTSQFVMAGLVPAIHALLCCCAIRRKAWMPAT